MFFISKYLPKIRINDKNGNNKIRFFDITIRQTRFYQLYHNKVMHGIHLSPIVNNYYKTTDIKNIWYF